MKLYQTPLVFRYNSSVLLNREYSLEMGGWISPGLISYWNSESSLLSKIIRVSVGFNWQDRMTYSTSCVWELSLFYDLIYSSKMLWKHFPYCLMFYKVLRLLLMMLNWQMVQWFIECANLTGLCNDQIAHGIFLFEYVSGKRSKIDQLINLWAKKRATICCSSKTWMMKMNYLFPLELENSSFPLAFWHQGSVSWNMRLQHLPFLPIQRRCIVADFHHFLSWSFKCRW